jgi:hypothetical protein
LCLGGCQSRNHESLLLANLQEHLRMRPDPTIKWLSMTNAFETISTILQLQRLISAVIVTWIQSVCQMVSAALSNILFNSIGICFSYSCSYIHYLHKYVFISTCIRFKLFYLYNIMYNFTLDLI